MGNSFLNACVVGTVTTNIVIPSRGSFLEVISGTKGVENISRRDFRPKKAYEFPKFLECGNSLH